MARILFEHATAVLMDEAGTILPQAYVTVEGSKISSVGSDRPQGPFDQVIDGSGQVLMPGLVNAHTHVPMTAMRGYGDGNNLQDWLYKYIFPVEDKWDGRAVRACTTLGLAEMISSGTTAIEDMYFFCDDVAQSVAAAGINANLTRGVNLFEEDYNPLTHPGTAEARALAETWHGYHDGQILVDMSIHGEYTSRPPLWEYLARYAKDKGLGMHVHISETQLEHEACIARHALTPAQAMDRYGVFDVRTLAAHCVWTTPEDWALFAKKGVTAVHNPCSNLKLGSGIAPVVAMMGAGVNVALGTDGVSSNNTTDLFEDLKVAAMLQNGVNHDPLSLLPMDALRMATVNGAKAMGRNTGRIAVGCDADLILVDFTRPNLIPCHDVVSNLVYAAHGCDVAMNMCRGKVIYRNGEFLTIDMAFIKQELEQYVLPLLFH